MKSLTRTTLAVLAVAAVAVGVTACDPDDSLSSPASLTTTPTSMADAYPHYADPTTLKPATPAPGYYLSHDGRWKVPDQIQPGDYQVTPTSGTGYWKLCRSITCEIGTDGFIENDLVSGPDFVTIPADARYILIRDIILTPGS